MTFDGLGMGLGSLSRLSAAKTRSISPENFTGEPGRGGMATEGTGAVAARELGQGWKVSPSIPIAGGEVVTLAEIEGPGAIQHIWLTCHPQYWRSLVWRIWWDDEASPSIETPLGDFFANGWCERCNISSLPIAVNPAGGFNSYWEMPFRRRARIAIENLSPDPVPALYYQVTYTLTDVPDDRAYFHAQWRRSNPLPLMRDHILLDGVQGEGHYVGTYVAWGVNNRGWWGEGEVKFYLDGDDQWPTICGTGTEDYFGGAWNFEHPTGQYGSFSTPFLGLPQIITPDGIYRSQQRFGKYCTGWWSIYGHPPPLDRRGPDRVRGGLRAAAIFKLASWSKLRRANQREVARKAERPGRPRRHGAEFAGKDPATWLAPTAEHVPEDAHYPAAAGPRVVGRSALALGTWPGSRPSRTHPASTVPVRTRCRSSARLLPGQNRVAEHRIDRRDAGRGPPPVRCLNPEWRGSG